MKIAVQQLARSPVTEPVNARSAAEPVLVLPQLLRCRVLTWSDHRAELLQTAAELETWQALVSQEVQPFLRHLFQHRLPLSFVDLPSETSRDYRLYQTAIERAAEMKELLVVCGGLQAPSEEQWARQLGVWAYLPGDNGLAGFRHVFGNARQAVARQDLTFVELDGYR